MPLEWSDAEASVLRRLDAAAASPAALAVLDRIAARVLATLARAPGEIEAWEAVPLDVYGAGAVPSDVGSSWVFALRRGVATGAERHPNSRQRMFGWSGGGDFQVHDGVRWVSHRLSSDRAAPIEERWLSIPPDTWHQGVVGDEDWVVVSFHTVPKAELVEERPDPEDPDPLHPSRTRRRKYADVIPP
jgi:hypothetical protein